MALHFRLPSTGGQREKERGRIDFHFPKLHLTSPSARPPSDSIACSFPVVVVAACSSRLPRQISRVGRKEREEDWKLLWDL